MTKSRSIRRALWSAGILVIGVLALWAFWWEPSSLRVVYQTATIQPWHAEHAGLRIAVMSDLHVGSPHWNLSKLKQVIDTTNREKPDLIVILGDFVIAGVLGGRFVPPEPIAEELSRMRAPLGVVAILGNHDWWYDGDRVRHALETQGIRVLVNQNLRLMFRGKAFWICGLDDLWTRGNHLQSTLAQIYDNEPIIVLMHNPDLFPEISGRVSLTLAGHTHGGQVDLPILGRPIVPSKFGQRYAYGFIEERGRRLFVTGGIGTSILPVRFRVEPEIVILTLL